MLEILQTLWHITELLGVLVIAVLWLAMRWSPVMAWVAFWLWAADWRRLGPALARGAWAPIVLLAVMIALVWSAISPSAWTIGGLTFPNFLWQSLAIIDLLLLAGFCGWLQSVFRCGPQEIRFEVVAAQGDGAHGHPHSGH